MRRTLMPIASYGNAIAKYQTPKLDTLVKCCAKPPGTHVKHIGRDPNEKARRYRVICELIQASTTPVTCAIAAKHANMDAAHLRGLVRNDPCCPFRFGEVLCGAHMRPPRCLVMKSK